MKDSSLATSPTVKEEEQVLTKHASSLPDTHRCSLPWRRHHVWDVTVGLVLRVGQQEVNSGCWQKREQNLCWNLLFLQSPEHEEPRGAYRHLVSLNRPANQGPHGTSSLLYFTGIKRTSLKLLMSYKSLLKCLFCFFLWLHIKRKMAFVLLLTKGKELEVYFNVTWLKQFK